MAQPMIAARVPNACAACYGQYPDRVHVDYRSAIEGGLVDPNRPRGPHVDWVVICEKCLRDGVALLPGEQRDRDAEHKALVASLEKELAEAAEYAKRLEAAIAARPAEREHQHPKVTPAAKQARQPRYGAKS